MKGNSMKGNLNKIVTIKETIQQWLSNPDNQQLLLRILAVSIIAWTTLYGIPELFISLYETYLGNFILLLLILIVSINNYKLGFIVFMVLFIIHRVIYLSVYKEQTKQQQGQQQGQQQTQKIQEGFTWSHDEVEDFLQLQSTVNPQIIYDVNQLKTYTSSDEMDTYMKNQVWPWSDDTQELYQELLDKNPNVRIYKTDGLNTAQKIYPEGAIQYIMKNQIDAANKHKKKHHNKHHNQNKKQLPSGWGKFGYTSGLIS
jgi:membrane protein implicated in regulation of membrane protease activity